MTTIQEYQSQIYNITKKFQHQKLKNVSYLNEIQRLKRQLNQKNSIIQKLQKQIQLLKSKVKPQRRDMTESLRLNKGSFQLSQPQSMNIPQINIYHNHNKMSISSMSDYEAQQQTYNVKLKMENSPVFRTNMISDLFNKKKITEFQNLTIQGQSIPQTNKIVPKKAMNTTHQKVFKFFQTFLLLQTIFNKQTQQIQPNIAYTYPQPLSKKTLSLQTQRVIKLYCYRKRVGKQLRNDEIINIVNYKGLQSYIFLINSEYTIQSRDRNKNAFNQAIQSINPNYNLFGICIQSPSVTKIDKSYYQTPKIFVILTYFPFVSFFINIITNLKNTFKNQEIQILNQKLLEKLIPKSFQDLSKIMISNFPVNLRFKCQDIYQNLSIPQKPYTDSLITQYAIACSNKLDSDFFSELLLLMLLQYSILIYSSNVTLLSQTILLFMYLIKPFKYPFLIIFNLPEQMNYMLDSPFPVIIGTTQTKKIQNSSINGYFNLDTLKVQKKPDLPSMTHCFNYIKASLKGKFSQQSEILKKIKFIINDEILGGLKKQKQTLMSPFLKAFRETQIYKNYTQ